MSSSVNSVSAGCARDPEGDAAAAPRGMRVNTRDAALDFTKGLLVLAMVGYHWANYFVGIEGYFYRFIRFVTPSFVFITGYLISSVYLSRVAREGPSPQSRLAWRGLKLFILFALLNLAGGALMNRNYNGRDLGMEAFFQHWKHIYVYGNGGAAFLVLLSISYLLWAGAALFSAGRQMRTAALCLTVALVAVIATLAHFHMGSGHLELGALGMCGLCLGLVSRLDHSVRRVPWAAVLVAYVLHWGALMMWGPVFVLQLVAVCLNLLIFYRLGLMAGGSWLTRTVVLLGTYSLLGYIAQICVLQMLRRVLQPLDDDVWKLVISATGAVVLTVCIVLATHQARRRTAIADRLYRLAFA